VSIQSKNPFFENDLSPLSGTDMIRIYRPRSINLNYLFYVPNDGELGSRNSHPPAMGELPGTINGYTNICTTHIASLLVSTFYSNG
jgi:hypothetical protein